MIHLKVYLNMEEFKGKIIHLISDGYIIPSEKKMIEIATKEQRKVDLLWFLNTFSDTDFGELMDELCDDSKEYINVTKTLLSWLGYQGGYYTQRLTFQQQLEDYNIKYISTGFSKDILMEPDDFRFALITLKTTQQDKIHKYYITREKILKSYIKYSKFFL